MCGRCPVKIPSRKEPLPVMDISSMKLPLALDRHKLSSARLDELPDQQFPRPPNKLMRVGAIHWLQDSAYDSFSDGRSIWQTLCDVVLGQKCPYRSRSAPLGIPTLMCCMLPDRRWYSVDTRRTLVYKIAFHPDQRIPVHVLSHNTQLADDKQRSRHWSRQQACSVKLNLRLHEMVPHGLAQFAFIRNVSALKTALDVSPPGRDVQCKWCWIQDLAPPDGSCLYPQSQVTEHDGSKDHMMNMQPLQRPISEQSGKETQEAAMEVMREVAQNESKRAQTEELQRSADVPMDDEDPWDLHWQALQSRVTDRPGEEMKQEAKEIPRNEPDEAQSEQSKQPHEAGETRGVELWMEMC
mmetsp:Transcript_109215/g.319695  ORF Transcript_109215/g.319695 Transcript_109215/m.319695 type:complete len:353 (-) Transcript_109215:257-1315(-)